jgi:chromate reductase, NAD(P)H dehydrogenase (quinone)
MTRVLVLAGSADGGSPSAQLAGAAARELALAAHSVTHLSLADYPLPLHDGEVSDRQGAPQAALDLARQLLAHDAVLIVTPEHNGGVPAALKNALDWVAHPKAGGARIFQEDRVFAVASAAVDRLGGVLALIMLRRILENGARALVIPEELALPAADRAFDGRGALAERERAAELRRLLEALTRRSALLRRGLEDHRT